MSIIRELDDQEKLDLPCFQNPGPWQDSNKVAVQKWAARQCVTRCSQRAWCEAQRLSVVEEFNVATGVWAGRIHTHRDREIPQMGEIYEPVSI